MTTHRARSLRRGCAALLALAVLAACNDGGADPPSPRVAEPGSASPDSLPSADPDRLGLDPAVLEEMAATARRKGSTCLLVARDGRIAQEWYADGTDATTTHPVYSVTKSVTSVLVGIAQDEGLLDVDDVASTWIPSWEGTPSEPVTVRDLLSNASGREWSTDLDYTKLVTRADMTGFAVGLDQATRPGQSWAYNNAAIQTLEAVLESATGAAVDEFAFQRLFGPLGMEDTSMASDASGNTMVYTGITSTCRDLARFGMLMLDSGRWDGEQVVSSAWVEASTGRSSTDLNAAYGFLWWVNRSGPLVDPLTELGRSDLDDPETPRGRLVPGAPADVFWAIGLGGQIVQVHRPTGTVVVRLGELGSGASEYGPQDTAQLLTDGVRRP